MAAIARHRTAISRTSLSRPVATAIADGLLRPETSVFDYGCGRGDDIKHLYALGYEATGWDPTHQPLARKNAANIVNLGYVVNVIEEPAERADTLRQAWELAQDLLIVSARMIWESRDLTGRVLGDGLVTRTGTFQKFFEQHELADWIKKTLGTQPIAAAPGVFYVFRDSSAEQRFLASRVYTRRPRTTITPAAMYEANEAILRPLFDFMSVHARAPKPTELFTDDLAAIKENLGSLGRAQRLVRQVTEDDYWKRISTQRRSELLIYIALSRFGRRPRFSHLDSSLAFDIRCSFGTYRDACEQADKMLLACGDPTAIYLNARSSTVGKQTPSALYVHRSAMVDIPPILQVYEGCARVLAGSVPEANMVKLSVTSPQVSYLVYPDFDRRAHPTLRTAVTVSLSRLSVDWRDYSQSENPPLLHRKEEFLGHSHPRRELYQRLTRSEVRAGLYEHPERIGTLKGWQAVLDEARCRVRGHRLVRSPN
jgi:DNA phosphorothioation-associated putative methyltransferase